MTCLFDPAIFDTAIFDSCGDVATVTPSGGYDDLRHALHFYDNHIPSRKREVAQDIVDKAAEQAVKTPIAAKAVATLFESPFIRSK